MIDLAEIMRLVDDHVSRTGETMTELSRRATGGNETIRNWRRRLDKGEEASASFQNVQAVLLAIGLRIEIDGARTRISGPIKIRDILERIDGISEADRMSFMAIITNAIKANAASPAQTDTGDQSAPETRRREASKDHPLSAAQRARQSSPEKLDNPRKEREDSR